MTAPTREQVAQAIHKAEGCEFACSFGSCKPDYHDYVAAEAVMSMIEAYGRAERVAALRAAADDIDAECRSSIDRCFCAGTPLLRKRANRIEQEDQ